MWVKEFKLEECILWWDKKGKATWLWYLIYNPGGDPSLKAIGEMRNFTIGYPDSKNLADAQLFAKDVMSKMMMELSGTPVS